MESDLNDALSNLYLRFILLDLQAKITPGMIVLITVYWTIVKPNLDVTKAFFDISIWNFIIFISFAWTIGFAIQGIGDFEIKGHSWNHYYPKWMSQKMWYKYFSIVLRNSPPVEINQFLRYAVIKEACSNTSLALLFSLLLVSINELINIRFNNIYLYVMSFSVYVLAILSLHYMHLQHVNRAYEYGNGIISRSPDCDHFAMDWAVESERFYEENKYEKAIMACDQAISLNPKLATPWYNKGTALRKLGRTKEADVAFAKAKELGYRD